MALFKRKKKEEGIPEPPDFLEFPEDKQYESGEIPEFSSLKEPSQRIKEWEEKPNKLPPRTRPYKEAKIKEKAKSKALYIKVEKFRDIVASIEMIARKIDELNDIAQKIKQIKAKEDSEIADWQNQLNAIKARLEAIEESLESKI